MWNQSWYASTSSAQSDRIKHSRRRMEILFIWCSLEEYKLLEHVLKHLHFGECVLVMTAEIKAERFAATCSKFLSHSVFPCIPFHILSCLKSLMIRKGCVLKILRLQGEFFSCCCGGCLMSKSKPCSFLKNWSWIVFGNAFNQRSHLPLYGKRGPILEQATYKPTQISQMLLSYHKQS